MSDTRSPMERAIDAACGLTVVNNRIPGAVTMRCPHCRKEAGAASHVTDPPGTAFVESPCIECRKVNPVITLRYFDKDNNEITTNMKKEQPTATPRIEVKLVRHTFTEPERNQLGGDLARQIATSRGIEAEFDQVKASFKAKTSEAESKIDSLSTSLMNGFEFRHKRCRVEYLPKERKKHYFLEEHTDGEPPTLIEDMTADDFQADLLQAESKFEHRTELQLFTPTHQDSGVMAVGMFQGSWYAALRVTIGQRKLEERLDSEQPCCKKRYDMICRAANRFSEWLTETLGKEAAKGFNEAVNKAVEAEKEKVE